MLKTIIRFILFFFFGFVVFIASGLNDRQNIAQSTIGVTIYIVLVAWFTNRKRDTKNWRTLLAIPAVFLVLAASHIYDALARFDFLPLIVAVVSLIIAVAALRHFYRKMMRKKLKSVIFVAFIEKEKVFYEKFIQLIAEAEPADADKRYKVGKFILDKYEVDGSKGFRVVREGFAPMYSVTSLFIYGDTKPHSIGREENGFDYSEKGRRYLKLFSKNEYYFHKACEEALRGCGVKDNFTDAKEWMKLAADKGHGPAIGWLKKIKEQHEAIAKHNYEAGERNRKAVEAYYEKEREKREAAERGRNNAAFSNISSAASSGHYSTDYGSGSKAPPEPPPSPTPSPRPAKAAKRAATRTVHTGSPNNLGDIHVTDESGNVVQTIHAGSPNNLGDVNVTRQ